MTTTFTGFIGGSYSDTQVDNRISLLLENAPETLDTLGELAAALQANDGELANLLSVNNTQNTQIAVLQGASHNAITLGTGSDPALTLSGQELTLTIPVDSVNSQTGAVSLDTDDIAEGATNNYFTNARVSASPNVAANTLARHDAVTLGTNTNGLSLTGQEIQLAEAVAHDNADAGGSAGSLAASDKRKLGGIKQTKVLSASTRAELLAIPPDVRQTWLINGGEALIAPPGVTLSVQYCSPNLQDDSASSGNTLTFNPNQTSEFYFVERSGNNFISFLNIQISDLAVDATDGRGLSIDSDYNISLALANTTTSGALSNTDFSRLATLGTFKNVDASTTVSIDTFNLASGSSIELRVASGGTITTTNPQQILVWSSLAQSFATLGAGNPFVQPTGVRSVYNLRRLANAYFLENKSYGDDWYLVTTADDTTTTNFNTNPAQVVPVTTETTTNSRFSVSNGVITVNQVCNVIYEAVVTVESTATNQTRAVLDGRFFINGVASLFDEGHQVYIRQANGSKKGTFRNKGFRQFFPNDTIEFRVGRAPNGTTVPCILSGLPRIFLTVTES